MSREIENLKHAFSKARIEGEAMLKDGRITWEMFCDVMKSFENDLRNRGVKV